MSLNGGTIKHLLVDEGGEAYVASGFFAEGNAVHYIVLDVWIPFYDFKSQTF